MKNPYHSEVILRYRKRGREKLNKNYTQSIVYLLPKMKQDSRLISAIASHK